MHWRGPANWPKATQNKLNEAGGGRAAGNPSGNPRTAFNPPPTRPLNSRRAGRVFAAAGRVQANDFMNNSCSKWLWSGCTAASPELFGASLYWMRAGYAQLQSDADAGSSILMQAGPCQRYSEPSCNPVLFCGIVKCSLLRCSLAFSHVKIWTYCAAFSSRFSI